MIPQTQKRPSDQRRCMRKDKLDRIEHLRCRTEYGSYGRRAYRLMTREGKGEKSAQIEKILDREDVLARLIEGSIALVAIPDDLDLEADWILRESDYDDLDCGWGSDNDLGYDDLGCDRESDYYDPSYDDFSHFGYRYYVDYGYFGFGSSVDDDMYSLDSEEYGNPEMSVSVFRLEADYPSSNPASKKKRTSQAKKSIADQRRHMRKDKQKRIALLFRRSKYVGWSREQFRREIREQKGKKSAMIEKILVREDARALMSLGYTDSDIDVLDYEVDQFLPNNGIVDLTDDDDLGFGQDIDDDVHDLDHEADMFLWEHSSADLVDDKLAGFNPIIDTEGGCSYAPFEAQLFADEIEATLRSRRRYHADPYDPDQDDDVTPPWLDSIHFAARP